MLLVNQYVGFGIAILGVLVALVALLEPLSHIAVVIVNYVQKLFSGPVKTQPLNHEDLTRHV